MSEVDVHLKFTHSEALVLFELVNHLDTGPVAELAEAERRVVWQITAQLERLLTDPLKPDYQERLERARATVRELPNQR